MADSSTQMSELGVYKRWYASRFLHCLFAFVGLTLAFAVFVPRLISAELANPPVGWKFAKYKAAPNKPNVLMLGSSLTLIPAVRADAVQAGQRTRIDEQACFQSLNYDKAEYFESKLKESGMADAHVLNMSMIAAMTSDYLMILQHMLDKHCKPDLIVCAVAPRDFVCLSHGANIVTNTYVRTQLNYIEKNYPELGIVGAIGGAKCTDWVAEQHFRVLAGWQAMKSTFTAKPMSVIAKALQKSPYSKQFDQKLLSTWAHEPLLYDYGPCYGPRLNVLGDMEQYKGYYQPPNWSGYEVQKKSFEQLMALAKSENIPIVLISMPLTDANMNLLDPALLNAYREDVHRIADKYHVPFFNLQNSQLFAVTDFEDSAHLNEFGGKKFFDLLAEQVSEMHEHGGSYVAQSSSLN